MVWINLCLYAAYVQVLLTAKESATLVTAVGDRLTNSTGVYAGSTKEPDLEIMPIGRQIPLIVLEAGCKSSIQGNVQRTQFERIFSTPAAASSQQLLVPKH
ncbi:hypothetical protein C8Q69DRAFT_447769 [Paecilomyces variotii]|uniref:Uncharacterized protein n=1 Tax=Byssochlamys spectabilis TaxID=264951 RepID=A0A443HK14_BYSSP|nr:hypothetical protein C8Q69DRAFT_447769 [Paecilomyces variotii]RWQ92076.1 hypothetical protein C8Q69DRAFT_447769 [Paecilomyces variotii]